MRLCGFITETMFVSWVGINGGKRGALQFTSTYSGLIVYGKSNRSWPSRSMSRVQTEWADHSHCRERRHGNEATTDAAYAGNNRARKNRQLVLQKQQYMIEKLV
jgi:hypothetical protein